MKAAFDPAIHDDNPALDAAFLGGMKRFRAASAALLIWASALGLSCDVAAAQTVLPLAQRLGRSVYTETDSGSVTKWRIENTAFERTDEGAVLEVRTVREAPPDGAETYPGTIDVTAWGKQGANYDRKLWTVHTRADKAEIRGNYLLTTQFGSGDGEDLRTYFDLATGVLGFLATTEPSFVHMANAQPSCQRVISFVSNRTLEPLDFTRRHPAASGLLTMRDNGKIVDRLVFTGTQWSPTVRLIDMSGQAGDRQSSSDLTLFGRETAAVDHAWDGLAVRLSFDDDDDRKVLTIRLRGSLFVLDGLKLPEGVGVFRETGT